MYPPQVGGTGGRTDVLLLSDHVDVEIDDVVPSACLPDSAVCSLYSSAVVVPVDISDGIVEPMTMCGGCCGASTFRPDSAAALTDATSTCVPDDAIVECDFFTRSVRLSSSVMCSLSSSVVVIPDDVSGGVVESLDRKSVV